MLTLVCGASFAVPAVGAGLSDRNSVPIEFGSTKPFIIEGTGCGATAAGSVTLASPPRGVSPAYAIRVLKPKVGARDGFVRVTGVQVSGQTMTVTAMADAAPCASDDPSTPPGQIGWRANFAPDVSLFRRVQVRLRSSPNAAPKLGAPRSLRLSGRGTMKVIRWKGFGSKTATATARYRVNIPGCTPRTCLGHRGRVRLKFTKVKRCAPFGLFEYSTLTLSFRGRMLFRDPGLC